MVGFINILVSIVISPVLYTALLCFTLTISDQKIVSGSLFFQKMKGLIVLSTLAMLAVSGIKNPTPNPDCSNEYSCSILDFCCTFWCIKIATKMYLLKIKFYCYYKQLIPSKILDKFLCCLLHRQNSIWKSWKTPNKKYQKMK